MDAWGHLGLPRPLGEQAAGLLRTLKAPGCRPRASSLFLLRSSHSRLGSPRNVWAGILAISFSVHTHGAAMFHVSLSPSRLPLRTSPDSSGGSKDALKGAGSSAAPGQSIFSLLTRTHGKVSYFRAQRGGGYTG